MTPDLFLTQALVPGLSWLTTVIGNKPGAGPWQNDARGRLILCAISGQESNWADVQQGGNGPGRGYFQFELETCGELLINPASQTMAIKVCNALKVIPQEDYVYTALLHYQNLQVAFARLDLWCDASPLPPYGDEMAAWQTYLRVWRPGKPSLERWTGNYLAALTADEQAYPGKIA